MSEQAEANLATDDDLSSVEGADESTAIPADQLDNAEDQDQPEEGQDPDEDLADLEFNGKTYKVPKPIIAERMMEADYRKKTMDLADQRRSLDADKAAYASANEEVIQAQAKVIAADQQLAQYQQIDWQTWAATDPGAAQSAFFQYQALRDQRGQFAEEAKAKQDTLSAEAKTLRERQLQEGLAVVQRDIPGWGPDLAAKLMDFGAKEFGYTRQELDGITDPRVIKAIHAAYQAKGIQQQKAKAAKLAEAQKTQPHPSLRGSNGQFAPAADTNDFAAFEKLADAKLKK